jgi:hypothetical protein
VSKARLFHLHLVNVEEVDVWVECRKKFAREGRLSRAVWPRYDDRIRHIISESPDASRLVRPTILPFSIGREREGDVGATTVRRLNRGGG